jgi:GNAT superfamily N-acetyltransferase
MKTNPSNTNFQLSRMYSFIRSRQLERTFPGSPSTGVWISTALRVSKGWGELEESLWPYDASHWPPIEPLGVDLHAKTHRVLAYQRISTIDECRIAIANSNSMPLIAINIDNSWNNPVNGRIANPKKQHITAAHTVVLLGYDDNDKMFHFINSWGTSWGDRGHGFLPYSYFPNRFLEGWSITAYDTLRPKRLKSNGVHLYSWEIEGLLGYPLYGIEFMDTIQDEMIAWAFAIEREDFLDIEELFVRPNWRRQGYACKIATEFNQLSLKLGKRLRVWIPHSDNISMNYSALDATLSHMHLSIEPSPVKWAAKVGL